MSTITEPRTIDDVVELLKDQHTQLKELMPQVIENTGKKRTEAFNMVCYMLAIHEALEQAIVHPHATSDAGEEQVSERVKEELEASDAITEMEGMDIDSKKFHDTYAEFMLDVLEHAEHEEHEEFEKIEHDFTPAELAQVTKAVEMIENPPAEMPVFEELLEQVKAELSA